eukprot:SAG22_NODE_15721_length_342_cov_0.930041_2_plen_61_part_01
MGLCVCVPVKEWRRGGDSGGVRGGRRPWRRTDPPGVGLGVLLPGVEVAGAGLAEELDVDAV